MACGNRRMCAQILRWLRVLKSSKASTGNVQKASTRLDMEDALSGPRSCPDEVPSPEWTNQAPQDIADLNIIKTQHAAASDAGTAISFLDLESDDPYPRLVVQEIMTGKKIYDGERPDDNARELAKRLTLEEQVS